MNTNQTVAATAVVVLSSFIMWWLWREDQRSAERHEFTTKMNNMMYDKLVIADLESGLGNG